MVLRNSSKSPETFFNHKTATSLNFHHARDVTQWQLDIGTMFIIIMGIVVSTAAGGS